ncbi:MAG: hypothetical protein IJ009_08260 [Clostridia bacterium]|nr:hypothetical protein [Clostridia bacterium]
MKSFFPTLLKNERHKAQFGEHILRGTLAHAYLLQGPTGTGKNFFAHLLSAALCCHRQGEDGIPLPCGICPACEKILSDKTPDLHHVTAGDGASIGIAAIHEIKSDMYLSATEQAKKIYIVHEAEKMTTAAQNALLVVLEEPPPDVVIFLLCEDATSLLPTVRSRVQTVRMSLFTEDELDAFLKTAGRDIRFSTIDKEHYRHLLTAAGGSPGKALSLLQTKELNASYAEKERARAILRAVMARADFLGIHEATAQLSTKRQELAAELQMLILAIRDLIVLKREEHAPLCFFSTPEEAEECGGSISMRCLFDLYDTLREAITQIRQNANVNTIVTILNTKFSSIHTKR